MSDQVNKPVCVATAEKSPEQLRHDSIYAWAVELGNIGGTSGNAKANLENFRVQWGEGNFETCYGKLMNYLKESPDADFTLAKDWKSWIESIRSGDFVPA
jgi:hypothetical protein